MCHLEEVVRLLTADSTESEFLRIPLLLTKGLLARYRMVVVDFAAAQADGDAGFFPFANDR
jgi:hypothetical protein